MSTQTYVVVVEFKDTAVQTDSDSLQVELSAHSDGDGQCTDSGEAESTLYQGNSDEKFIPLIVKYKGVFSDLTD